MSADLPPAPVIRHITPAPEDYATRPATSSLLWPLLWMGAAVLLWLALR